MLVERIGVGHFKCGEIEIIQFAPTEVVVLPKNENITITGPWLQADQMFIIFEVFNEAANSRKD